MPWSFFSFFAPASASPALFGSFLLGSFPHSPFHQPQSTHSSCPQLHQTCLPNYNTPPCGCPPDLLMLSSGFPLQETNMNPACTLPSRFSLLIETEPSANPDCEVHLGFSCATPIPYAAFHIDAFHSTGQLNDLFRKLITYGSLLLLHFQVPCGCPPQFLLLSSGSLVLTCQLPSGFSLLETTGILHTY